MKPIILWMRRDFRLTDNPALDAAATSRRPVLPVFLLDEVAESWGAAPKWRAGLGLEALAGALEALGSRLVLRRGDALEALRALVRETGADIVCWNRLHVPDERARDARVEEGLGGAGVELRTFAGHVLFDPESVRTKTGGYYKVYTPYWRAVRGRGVDPALAAPDTLAAPGDWPASDRLEDWGLARGMRRGARVVAGHVHVGERAARARLETFLDDRVDDYATERDELAADGSSGLSENLTWGEISARTCWHAGQRALDEGRAGGETFLRELAWRDFAHHLAYHTRHITSANWKPRWDAFPWKEDGPDAEAWRRGCTGLDVVDAAMRELYVTGRMHNRARMLAGSYLCKHLMTHWKVGQAWFAETLVDWDPASNALGWQWIAGSGPDASPFFRIFNPQTQADKFDADGEYRRRWLSCEDFYDAVPRSWQLDGTSRPREAIVGLAEGRARALEAYGQRPAG